MNVDKIFESESEVLAYYEQDKDNNQVVIFENVVYDVKEYMPEHPGGADYIGKNLGKSIDEDFEEAEHTKFARKLFNDLPVRGRMKEHINESKGSTTSTSSGKQRGDPVVDHDYVQPGGHQKPKTVQFDYSKGVVMQVWRQEWTYEEYMQFVNEPKQFVNPVRDLRMFDSDLIEPFTKCPWYAIVVFWFVYLLQFVPYLGKDVAKEAAIIFLGAQCFLFVEYVLHRFLFHGEHTWMQYVPKNSYFYFTHFLLHGIHHAFPQDKHRLVLPPALGYFYFAVLFSQPFQLLVPADLLPAWTVGFVLGYLIYDLTHYFIHHSNPPEGSYFKMMKSYHMQHHYKNGTEGYGISNKIWDKVFDTEIKNDYNAHAKK